MGLTLRPYQETAADFLFERDRAMILAPVGAGKTAITLTAMQDMILRGVVKRFLVLAPKRVCTDVWPVEGPKWAPLLKISIAVGNQAARSAALKSNAPVVVTNYDNLQWLSGQALNFDAIVFDELTRLKNPSGARFKALHKVIGPMSIRWGLTGSFTSNGLEDVFGQCKIIDERLLGRSKGAFLQQHFILVNKDYGEWEPRSGALEAVMQKIKPATFLLDPGEYSDTLPPLNLVPLHSPLDDRGPYEKMKKTFVAQFGTATITALNAGVVTAKLQQMGSGFVYQTTQTPSDTPGKFTTTQTPHWFSTHKFDALDDLLQENQKANTIIAYWYKEELAELKRRYPKAVTLDDDRAVERWNRGEIELLLLHPRSAGHGLNLQHGGCRIVFVSLPWSLELFEQTIGRLHRSGQRHAVWVYALLSTDTVDEQIWAALHDKRDISDVALEALR
jgi:SNF2 family DNA or RNA helicase